MFERIKNGLQYLKPVDIVIMRPDVAAAQVLESIRVARVDRLATQRAMQTNYGCAN